MKMLFTIIILVSVLNVAFSKSIAQPLHYTLLTQETIPIDYAPAPVSYAAPAPAPALVSYSAPAPAPVSYAAPASVSYTAPVPATVPVVLTNSFDTGKLKTLAKPFFGASFLPTNVGLKSAAVAGAIPAGAAIAGGAIGSAIATPIILKSIVIPGAAAAKTEALLAAPYLLKSKLKPIAVAGVESLNKGSVGILSKLKSGAEAVKNGAVSLASKGTAAIKDGTIVAGGLILKPIAVVAGTKLGLLGASTSLLGKGVALAGSKIKKVGDGLKIGGLATTGLGATAIGWGFDKSTITSHLPQVNLINQLPTFNLPLDLSLGSIIKPVKTLPVKTIPVKTLQTVQVQPSYQIAENPGAPYYTSY